MVTNPPKLLDFVPSTTRVSAVEDLLEHSQQVIGLLQDNLVATQAKMKLQADKHRQERQFEIGDWVLLRLQPFKQKTMHKKLGKLGRKFYGPFKVLGKIRAVSYKLELLEDAKIHHVFHVSCLKAKVGQFITPLYKMPPVDSLGHLAPEPTKILETRVVKKRRLPAVTEVLVFWEGATKEDAT
jgi:hypothetical protein